MIDMHGRTIDYMRVSITDSCNLQCRYCLPNCINLVEQPGLLSNKQLLLICKAAVSLGIVKFKITGGEPLVRRDCIDFIEALKKTRGVEQVTITTNGIYLDDYLDRLVECEINGINISLDTLSDERYFSITGFRFSTEKIINAIYKSSLTCVPTKVNTVLLEENFDEVPAIAKLAENNNIDVRFIELMPLGAGVGIKRIPMSEAFAKLQSHWPDLHPVHGRIGNGPAKYYASKSLKGRIGLISAVSDCFCHGCNRVRLTSRGDLKPCLCYDAGVNLSETLCKSDNQLRQIMSDTIFHKPLAHCFSDRERITEIRSMNQIGG